MKKIYIVGKNYKNQVGGPANIIRGLLRGLKNYSIPVQEICLNEHFGKFSLIKQLLKIFFKEKDSIVNVHTDGLMLPYLVYLFSKFDKKNTYFLTVHGIYGIESKINGTYQKRYDKIEKILYKKFPQIICVSELLKQKLITDFNRTKPTYVLPNGIDEINIELKNKNINIPLKFIMLGGMRDRKGVLESIEVIDYLNKNGISSELDIYGIIENDEILKKVNNKIQLLGLSQKIRYQGVLTDKEKVYETLDSADIQLCLSKWDTFNVAIVESLAIATPCIVTVNCGAKCAVTENRNGLIVDLNTAEKEYLTEIKNFAVGLLNNDCNEIIKLAKDIQNEYSWDIIAEKFLFIIYPPKNN